MSFLRRLLGGESGLTDVDRQRLRQFLDLKPKFDAIVDGVDGAFRRGDAGAKARALESAASELPGLISKWDEIPLPEDGRRREAAQLFGDGMRMYAHACSRYLKWYETSDDSIGLEAAQLIQQAGKLMQESSRKSGVW